jgi:phage terminase large subunit
MAKGKKTGGRVTGFDCATPIKNTGAGAAMMRIEAARRVFRRCWFNESTTEAGRDALGYYHEHKDENRNVGLGPEHDWSSNCADAFGYLAIFLRGAAGEQFEWAQQT